MTRIITVTNQKGGVGKTTTASTLICGLHHRGARVLGVDVDPQGNLGFSLGLDGEGMPTLYDVFTGTHPIQDTIVHTRYGDVIPADIMLSGVDVSFTAPQREFMLTKFLDTIKTFYDFIIIDTPPSLNLLTINAYVASTELIIPMEAEVLSLVGISQILDTINTVRASFNPGLKVLGILMNKYDSRTRLCREMLDLAKDIAGQMNSRVFPVHVHRGTDVARAPAHGQSILSYKPGSKPARDLEAFVSIIAGDQFPPVNTPY